MKWLLILFLPCLCVAEDKPELFSSSCNNVSYSILSYCHKNNLREDQDRFDGPVCNKQILTISGEEIDLSKVAGKIYRVDYKNDNIEIMKYVFYGVSCKKDQIILSAYGGCNSCGEMFKRYDFSGKEVLGGFDNAELEPMEDINTYQ